MARLVAGRLLWAAGLMLAVSVATFVVFWLLPSTDPALLRAGRSGDPFVLAAIREELGLDESEPAQYLHYLERLVLHLDLGTSYASGTGEPVIDAILDRLPVTLALTAGAVVVWMVVAVPAGVMSAVYPRSAADRITTFLTLLALAAPVYWLGLVALYLFSDDIGTLAPVFGGSGSYVAPGEDLGGWVHSLLLPWFVLAASFAAVYARMLRSSLLDVLDQDFVRTARAKGLRERRVIWRHGVRAAIGPVVTMLGIDVGALLGGAILVEIVFNLPGLGRLAYDAMQTGDVPVVQGTVLLGAFVVVVANLLVDIAYGVLDPRVREG